MRFHLLTSIIFAITFSCAPTFGCSCVAPPPDLKTAQGLAQWEATRSDEIFEGKVENIQLKWNLLDAKVGELIPADVEGQPPFIQVSFETTRSYRGPQRKAVELRTGLGGGDCGFRFEVGKRYLIYALADESGELSTNICSGTALLEESQSNLAYLRGESVVSERVGKNSTIATGKLCGHLVREGLDFSGSQILLLPVGSESPLQFDEAEPAEDGSFCLTGLTPGKYQLLFRNGDESSPTSFTFFPGVMKSSEATAIDVIEGQSNPELIFNIPIQPGFSVSGTVLMSKQSALPNGSKVILWSAEPLSFQLAYSQDVSPNGSFDFAQVLPGKYWAFVTVDSDAPSKWLTRKVEVNVDVRVANLSLELITD
jgi:hypothetical protein